MIIAVKDHLKIEVRLNDERVAITVLDMDGIDWFWDSWKQQEEQLAEKHLRTRYQNYAYQELANYLQGEGWEIAESNFSKS